MLKGLLFFAYVLFSWTLVIYGVNVYYLLIRSLRKHSIPKKIRFDNYPLITVQLPIYNEMYVARRLIEAVCRFDYPKLKMQIQVLDDSNDDTGKICSEVVREFRRKGYDIKHIRRDKRIGFKAGALQNGLAMAKGEFITIFDADFIPQPEFLVDIISYFSSEE